MGVGVSVGGGGWGGGGGGGCGGGWGGGGGGGWGGSVVSSLLKVHCVPLLGLIISSFSCCVPVNYAPVLEFIQNKTAAPYFSNLVWFIGNHIIELDECLISQAQ